MAHIHDVVDTDIHYKINGVTREVTNINETKRILVQNDHNSERFTFEIPRYIDGHDLSSCNRVQVHYTNVSMNGKEQNVGVYDIEDVGIKMDDEEVVIFTWLISDNATKYAGTINFNIRFACINEDGIAEYIWNTIVYKSIYVSENICNIKEIIERYPDVIESLLARMNRVENNNGGSVDSENGRAVYRPCGAVSNLDELLEIPDKSVGDVYNIKTGGSVATFITPNWECVTTKIDGKTYLRIKDKGVDITNAIPKGFEILPFFMDGFNNLTEYGWEIMDVASLPEDWDKQLGYNIYVYCNAGDNAAWTGIEWDVFSGAIDLSDYYNKESIGDLLKGKQDTANMIQAIGDYRKDKYPSENAVQSFVYGLLDEEIVESNAFPGPDFPTTYAVVNYVNDKMKTNIVDYRSSDLLVFLSGMYKSEVRAYDTPVINIYFEDGEYEPDYISGLSFYSGEQATQLSYTISDIINWVGTDCSADTYTGDSGVEQQVSKFIPSPNTYYDIVFYFNGVQFIGLVNGYVPASKNEVI